MSRKCSLTGKNAQFGNSVSHSHHKERKKFGVNEHKLSLYSEALKKVFQLRLTVSTLRSIEHNGGLDNYLLKTSNTKLTDEAIAIKKKIKKAAATS
jgi:large subunit ribosomal protein L28